MNIKKKSLIKLRLKDTIKNPPKVEIPEKGKGSYKREKKVIYENLFRS